MRNAERIDPERIAAEAMAQVRARARGAAEHPASGGYGSKLERLGLSAAECLDVSRPLVHALAKVPGRDVIRIAMALVESRTFDGRQVAYDLLREHRGAIPEITAADLGVLGRGMDNWATVDSFACWVSGPAWRIGRIDDARVHRWARSPDRWWRRAALVSTVALNLKSRGGTGDVPRTLGVCGMLVNDMDDMVAKGMSWALRELAKRDRVAVLRFMDRHEGALAPRVVREVTNKVETGLKNPRRSERE